MENKFIKTQEMLIQDIMGEIYEILDRQEELMLLDAEERDIVMKRADALFDDWMLALAVEVREDE